jgi:hypothetical protein
MLRNFGISGNQESQAIGLRMGDDQAVERIARPFLIQCGSRNGKKR